VSLRREELGIYGTRIIDFGVSNTRPTVGEDIYVTGTLQTHTPILCWWEGLGGETVRIVADDRELGTALTGGDGVFHFHWRPTTVGEFWIKTVYPGTWRFDPCESHSIKVTVISKEEKEEEERRWWLLVAGIGGVMLVAIVGVVAWMESSRRREMMLMALRGR